MVNVFPPDHVNDIPEVEPNQPEHALVDKNEEPEEEEEFEDEEEFEEEEPQEKEEDMEVDPHNPPPPASNSESEDVVEVEDMVEPEDETVPNSVHEVGKSSTATFLREGGDSLLPVFMRRNINSLFVRSSVEEATTALESLVRKFGNAKERAESAIERMITSRVNEALAADRARSVNASGAGGSGQGAVELRRWFEKTEMVFEISECAEGKKVKFDVATLQGPALTWWNSKVATMGLEAVNQIPWTGMKQLMTAEFCPEEEVQRMEHELWNLKVKEFNIVAYT
ncbi:hypothetical protein Tco_0858874 [Tanacetum coccineum]|uniref:Retrotransposon gag domain-containing protein n=1 Tax=Tanacetum coccineum TaxID=301880 RepID=A0ABQ5BDR0_9ASTR